MATKLTRQKFYGALGFLANHDEDTRQLAVDWLRAAGYTKRLALETIRGLQHGSSQT